MQHYSEKLAVFMDKTQKQLPAACFKIFTGPRRFHARVVWMPSDLYKSSGKLYKTLGSHLNNTRKIFLSLILSSFSRMLRGCTNEMGKFNAIVQSVVVVIVDVAAVVVRCFCYCPYRCSCCCSCY